MGSENVAKVLVDWPGLQPRQMTVLAQMALMSMDGAEPPVFYAGKENLAGALGYSWHDVAAVEKAAARVIDELRKAGAVVWSGRAFTGVRATYALALDPCCTYEPKGRGRNLQWDRVARDPKTVPGIRPRNGNSTEELPRDGGSVGTEVGQRATPPRGTSENRATPPGGKEVPQPGKELPRHGEKSYPTTGDPNSTEFNINSTSIQPAAPYVTREPTRASEKVDALDGNWSEEDERARQLAGLRELQKKIDAEQKEAS